MTEYTSQQKWDRALKYAIDTWNKRVKEEQR